MTDSERIIKATFFVPLDKIGEFSIWLSNMPVGRQVIGIDDSASKTKGKE